LSENTTGNNNGYDTTIIYDYNEQPDIKAGRCDNCGQSHFKSTVQNLVFIRECIKCGMKKSI
jgi:hypothetical protein